MERTISLRIPPKAKVSRFLFPQIVLFGMVWLRQYRCDDGGYLACFSIYRAPSKSKTVARSIHFNGTGILPMFLSSSWEEYSAAFITCVTSPIQSRRHRPTMDNLDQYHLHNIVPPLLPFYQIKSSLLDINSSLWPLLKKDGLALQYFIFLPLWLFLSYEPTPLTLTKMIHLVTPPLRDMG